MPGGGSKPQKGGFDLFMLLSLILFIASATLAVGVFLYVQYMTASSASKLEQLNRAKSAFEPALIGELTRLDDRMRAADEVLSTHLAPSALFGVLEQLTLQTVSFSSLEFTGLSSSEMRLSMQGLAQSVNSIALEADLLSKSGVITNPIFSNINRTLGGVRFDFTSGVDPTKMRYRTVLESRQPAPQAQPDLSAPFGIPQEQPQGPAAPSVEQLSQ